MGAEGGTLGFAGAQNPSCSMFCLRNMYTIDPDAPLLYFQALPESHVDAPDKRTFEERKVDYVNLEGGAEVQSQTAVRPK